MPKLEPAGISRKISLSQIIDAGNIRELEKYGPDKNGVFPESIQELGDSIKQIGQLQPIVVKTGEIVDGIQQYELVAGFRRRAAFQYLCGKGDDFNQIEAIIKTGETLILQLVENIQRSDLSAQERERGIYQMFESGVKQNQIASQLSKSKSYVSIHIAAFKMRIIANREGIETGDIETSTLSELMGIPDSDIPEILKKLVNFGGTRAAARTIVKSYQEKKNPGLDLNGGDDIPPATGESFAGETGENAPPVPAPFPVAPALPPYTLPPADPFGAPHTGAAPGPDETPPAEPPPAWDDSAIPFPNEDPPPAPAPAKKPEKPPAPRSREPIERDPIEAEHAFIDVNLILTGIYDYIDAINKAMPENGIDSEKETAKIESAKNIIAIIHGVIEK